MHNTMDESTPKLANILGEQLLKEIASQDSNLTNTTEIHCHCDTLILRPNSAKLILPNDSMLNIEKELQNFQKGDKIFKDIVRGCYWLVDDMYNFEHMGYTKEINAQNTAQQSPSSILNGLRYLVCAECNLCPLGWFDPNTKESFLHVWTNKKQTS